MRVGGWCQFEQLGHNPAYRYWLGGGSANGPPCCYRRVYALVSSLAVMAPDEAAVPLDKKALKAAKAAEKAAAKAAKAAEKEAAKVAKQEVRSGHRSRRSCLERIFGALTNGVTDLLHVGERGQAEGQTGDQRCARRW